MSEHKDYISRVDDLGNIHISEEVLAVIAAAATLEVDGVGSLAANLGKDIAQLLVKKNMSKGIRVALEGESVSIEVSLLIKYGYTLMDVAKQVQESVGAAVEATTGLSVTEVNVHVCGVTFEKENKVTQE